MFEKLKDYLNKEITNLENELATIEKAKENYKNLSQIKLFLDDTENYQKLFSQDLLTSDETSNSKDNISFLNNLTSLISKFENDFSSVGELEFELVLSNMDISLEKQGEFKSNLSTFKQLYPYISDIEYDDDSIKTMVNNGIEEILTILRIHHKQTLDKIIKELKEFYDKSILELNKLIKQSETINKTLDTIKYYDSLFTNDGPIHLFKNDNLFNEFLEYLKNSSLDIAIQTQIVIEISKYNLEYLSKIAKENNSFITEIVDDNLQSINDQLEQAFQDDLEEVVVEDNIIDTLNDEEKKIFNRINEIISLHSNYVYEDTIDMLKGDFSINSRECLYYLNSKLDWNIIISDIKNNLLPSIKTNKTECFVVFKYICDCYSKELIQEERIALLKQMIEKTTEIKEEHRSLIEEYSNNKEYYNWIVEHAEDSNIDIDSYINDVGKTIKWLRLGYFLVNKLVNYNVQLTKHISSYDINEEIVKKSTDEFRKLIEDYKKELAWEEGKKEKPVDDNDNISIGNHNLVFFLEEQEDLSFNLKNELIATIKASTNSSFQKLKATNDQLSIVKYRKPNKVEVAHRYDTFGVYRFRGLADSRTGMIKFSICEENKEKIRQKYNLEKEYAILAIFMPISIPSADHSEYKKLNKYVFTNMDYLERIGKLFNDPNTPVEKLYEIIDRGIAIREDVINDFKKTRGAKG